MATHSRVLAWRIPGMGEPDGLPSLGSHRVEHDLSDLAVAASVNLFMDNSLVVVKGLVQLNGAMNYAMQGHLRWTSHSEEF